MNTTDFGFIVASLLGGTAIGLVFFGGLHWTIGRLADSDQPALLVFSSFVIRSAITLAGFYLVAGGQWQRIMAAAAGFWLARVAMVIWLKRSSSPGTNEMRQQHGTQS